MIHESHKITKYNISKSSKMEIWGRLKDKFKSKENCVVPNCETKRNKNNSQVTLFSFPKNEALKKIWSDNLGITDCMFLKYQKLRVCSLHFSSDAIIWAGNRFILTSKNVVPNKIAKKVIPEPLAEVVPQPSTFTNFKTNQRIQHNAYKAAIKPINYF